MRVLGGATANKIAKLIRTISQNCQALCVTHLPQIAAAAQQHLLVRRADDDQSQIQILPKQQRCQELARMLTGKDDDANALATANELLESY